MQPREDGSTHKGEARGSIPHAADRDSRLGKVNWNAPQSDTRLGLHHGEQITYMQVAVELSLFLLCQEPASDFTASSSMRVRSDSPNSIDSKCRAVSGEILSFRPSSRRAQITGS